MSAKSERKEMVLLVSGVVILVLGIICLNSDFVGYKRAGAVFGFSGAVLVFCAMYESLKDDFAAFFKEHKQR